MPLLADSINFQAIRSSRQRLCEILVFILTLISACRRMSNGLSQIALRSCVSCAAFVDMFYVYQSPLYCRG